ncbi:MAG: protein-S-isoprenylcysteine O-methyltransferase [Candidatus Kapaibacterium sp.]
MNPLFGKILFLIGMVASIAIRVPHDKVSKATKNIYSGKDVLEKVLLLLVIVGGFLLPGLFIFTSTFSFADYALSPLSFGGGLVCMMMYLWLFYRSHADLGRNWSVSLELRENHSLVVSGVYKAIRHPMYTAIFLSMISQALFLANWIAGPSGFIVFTLMFCFRLHREERMMAGQFGKSYDDYRARTKRLVPKVW